MRKRFTREEIIDEFKRTHGDRYDYSLVDYVNTRTPVNIVCKKHGSFQQRPGDHKDGHGCPLCAVEKDAKRKTKTTEKFISDAKAVHGDKYSYYKAIYKGKKEKVTITCPIHGDFDMLPNNHTSMRQGCPYCAKEKETMTTAGFIKRATEVHGDRYDYDKVNYVNYYTPVMITCQIHGDFPQLPYNHLRGHSCQSCKQSHLEAKTMLALKKNNVKYEAQKRFSWLKNKNPMSLDFYLPEYNAAIECQGQQHYEATGGMFTEERMKYTQENDTLKFNLCKEHGIPIYYIRYDEDFKESINSLINNVLKQNVSSK